MYDVVTKVHVRYLICRWVSCQCQSTERLYSLCVYCELCAVCSRNVDRLKIHSTFCVKTQQNSNLSLLLVQSKDFQTDCIHRKFLKFNMIILAGADPDISFGGGGMRRLRRLGRAPQAPGSRRRRRQGGGVWVGVVPLPSTDGVWGGAVIVTKYLLLTNIFLTCLYYRHQSVNTYIWQANYTYPGICIYV